MLTKRRKLLAAAATIAVVSVLQAGCAGKAPPYQAYDAPEPGALPHDGRRSRWEKYDTPPHAQRQPPEGRRPWAVPEGVTAHGWKHIVIHHSATGEGSARAFDRYHRKVKGWKGLAYHFVIGNGTGTSDGAVEVGYRWKSQSVGAHAGVREYNQYGIGICLVGDFEHSVPTKKQMASLRELLGRLTGRFKIRPENVVRHRDVGETKCPGRNFPWPVAGVDKAVDGKPDRKAAAGPDGRLREEARKRLGIY